MKLRFCTLNGESGHIAGRKLLETLYREETGEDLPEILSGKFGKPYFPNAPYCFSISHTKNHAFCVLSEKNVGLDAEELTRTVKSGLAEKILSPAEFAEYTRAADKNRALLTFWVLKEAAAKLSGEGLRGYPKNTDFSLNDPSVQEIDGCLVAVLTENEE